MDCLYGGLEVIAAVGRQLFGAVQQLGGTLPHPLRETFLIRSIGLRKIPLVFFCSPEVLELSSERTIIKIPLNYRTKNHLDAMYFGVIAVAADITGGLAAYKVIRESGREVSLVFKDFKADFIKRIEGDATFTVQMASQFRNSCRKCSRPIFVKICQFGLRRGCQSCWVMRWSDVLS